MLLQPRLPAAPRLVPASTLELTLRAAEPRHERLIAALRPFGFERFWQEEQRLRAYVPAAGWDEREREQMETQLRALEVEGPLTIRPVAEKNWNVHWEASLTPIDAGPFLVKPTHIDAPAGREARFVLNIDPEMSFGTGHHPSTRLALCLLAAAHEAGDLRDARVLDAGTGTGILAIAAARLGAARVLAFDADTRVLDNARQNLTRNGIAAGSEDGGPEDGGPVELRAGAFAEAVPDEDGFDLILANINRGALSDLLPAFRRRLAPGGKVVLAGLLASDRAPMLDRAAACGLAPREEANESEWWAVRLGVGAGERKSRENPAR
ncbi:MAG: 50S ribosomal protein L11 methyltransferase [Bacteroidetes bacterium QS_7_67_15]|nr:MAG: 50S ribosomal protein L11 methyltransferase [Bacteroidetes bacterium QS_7_67_15]